jgi:hypothetical protein
VLRYASARLNLGQLLDHVSALKRPADRLRGYAIALLCHYDGKTLCESDTLTMVGALVDRIVRLTGQSHRQVIAQTRRRIQDDPKCVCYQEQFCVLRPGESAFVTRADGTTQLLMPHPPNQPATQAQYVADVLGFARSTPEVWAPLCHQHDQWLSSCRGVCDA